MIRCYAKNTFFRNETTVLIHGDLDSDVVNSPPYMAFDANP